MSMVYSSVFINNSYEEVTVFNNVDIKRLDGLKRRLLPNDFNLPNDLNIMGRLT